MSARKDGAVPRKKKTHLIFKRGTNVIKCQKKLIVKSLVARTTETAWAESREKGYPVEKTRRGREEGENCATRSGKGSEEGPFTPDDNP